MARVYLDYDGKKWKEVEKSDFWIDKFLYEKLQNLKMIQEKEWDGVILIDGKERSGKSTLGMICGWYLSNGNITERNFARGLSDAALKISELPDKSVLVVDEGSTLFSSKDSSTQLQKKLIKILDVVGQKNLIIIICLPCFFDLNKTIAVRRSLFLCHVYPDDKYDRGQYAFWGERPKARLYRLGKKDFDSYGYPKADFIGEYFKFRPPFYEKYLKNIKAQSLKEVLEAAVDKPTREFDVTTFKNRILGRINIINPEITHDVLAEWFEMARPDVTKAITGYKLALKRLKQIEIETIIKENPLFVVDLENNNESFNKEN